MAHDVFISYSSKDKPVADAICNGLEHDGIRCWMAPRDILPGTNWGESIINAIGASKAMVIVFSSNSNGSTQVLREVERAVSKNVIILPFRIQDITPSGAMEYFIGTEHWLDAMSPPMEAHIQRLSTTLQKLLGLEETPRPEPESPKPVPRKILGLARKQLILAAVGIATIGVFCLAAASFGVYKYITGRATPTLSIPNISSATLTSLPAGSQLPTATLTPGTAPVGATGATWLLLTNLPRNINTFAVDPTNPQVIYAGSELRGNQSGLIYKSEDGGITWKTTPAGLGNRAIKSLAISGDNPPVIYANVESDIYSSHDGAQTWQKVGTNTYTCCGFGREIHISPADSKILFITEPPGSFTRSLDGGQNWNAVNIHGLPANIEGITQGVSLAFDPSQPNTIYMGSNGAGVYKSIDGGDTWSVANQAMVDNIIKSLAVDPTNTQRVFAGSDRGKLYRSLDGGGTWNDITGQVPYPSEYTGEVMDITLDPTGTLYILVQGAGLFTSTDGGDQWRPLGKPGSLESPTFNTAVYIFGSEPTILLAAQDSGAWRYAANQPAQAPTPTLPTPIAANPAQLPVGSWQALADLPRRVNSVAIDPTNPMVMYAGTGIYGSGGGGLYKSEDSGLTWKAVSAALGNEVTFAVGASATSPGTVFAVVGVRGDFYTSSDGAASWLKVGVNSLVGGNQATYLFTSPKDNKVLILLEDWGPFTYSLDGGQNWFSSTLGEPVQPGGMTIPVMSAAFDPTDANIIYAGTNGSGVWKSSDRGSSWQPANKGMLDYKIKSLAVDPANTRVIYAGGADREGLFKSIDGGLTWVNLTSRLPFQDPGYIPAVQYIFIDPNAPDTVYLIIDRTGLVASTDGGLSWRLVGKPGTIDSPSFTTACMVFTPQSLLIAGINDHGGWRYSVP
jgi:photosystem II stability/assembly factor-like uncharacterized protein